MSGDPRGSDPAAGGPPASQPVTLDREAIETVARRVVELFAAGAGHDSDDAAKRLLCAAEVAEWWGVERAWVYHHADQLGAIRLGDGPRPRLRFDPDLVARRLGTVSGTRARRRSARRLAPIAPDRVLLPILGDAELSSSGDTNRSRPGGAQTPPAPAPKKRPSAR
jgi:hypothetical protein